MNLRLEELRRRLLEPGALPANGKTVYQRSGALDMSAAQSLGEGQKRMALALPELTPGWYRAALVMSSKGQFVLPANATG